MAITSERLRQTFSEGGALEIYQEIKSKGDFLGFAQRYAFDTDYRVARSALWGLTKAQDKELSELQAIRNELINQAMQTDNSSVRRLTLNIIERLKMNEEDLRTDFLDFARRYVFDKDYRVARSALWGLTKATDEELSELQVILNELMDELKRTLEAMEIVYYKPAIKSLRKRILSGQYQ